MTAPLRTLGPNGPKVSPVGLGFGSISGFYGSAGTMDEKVALLDHAHETGLRFWDLADIYHDAEDIVGEWVKQSGKRDEVFLATKFGLQHTADGVHTFRTDPEYVKSACEKSLQRMNVDTIDLFYCHRVDGVTPIEKTIEAMVELQGKIRHLGLSGVSASTLRRAHAVHPIAALQMEYSLFNLDIETPGSGILDTSRELGVTVVAFCPVGRGVLTGQFRCHQDIPDHRRNLPKYSQENFPSILKIVRKLEETGAAHGKTPAQIALAWLLTQGSDIIPIPGTKSAVRMDENAGAALVKLNADEVKEIRSLVKETKILGTQYPAVVMASMQQETPPLR